MAGEAVNPPANIPPRCRGPGRRLPFPGSTPPRESFDPEHSDETPVVLTGHLATGSP
jgi:hypothetical protein